MTYARQVALIGVVLFLVAFKAYAEVVTWDKCPHHDANAPSNCTIHEVRIVPCKEASERKPCRLKRGVNASIEFDYTINYESDHLEAKAFWMNEWLDLPFVGLDHNACVSTSCPTVPGRRQSYHQELPISKNYPVRIYDVKWIIANPSGQECCFVFHIKIHK